MPKFRKLRTYRPSGIEVGIFTKGGKRQVRITAERDTFSAVETSGKNKTEWIELWQNKKWILKKGLSVLDANKGESVYLMIHKREKRQFRIYADDFNRTEFGMMLGILKQDAYGSKKHHD
jgi:hypothetical protein